jgi:hypothetical protein
MKIFYFGCNRQAGHYLFTKRLVSAYPESPPWSVDSGEVDGKLPPHEPDCKNHYYCRCQQVEGVAAIHHKDGWTAMAFWGRSVDDRRGCNSVFFAEGCHDFSGMLTIAKENFPTIMSRFAFAMTEHKLASNSLFNGSMNQLDQPSPFR